MYLACQRKAGAKFGLKWEFPGGKLESSETAREALVRELREELGVKVTSSKLFHTQVWTYKDKSGVEETFRVMYFRVLEFSGEPVNRSFETIRWVTYRELKALDILEGNQEAIDLLGVMGE
jgi:8-oxo-dGTP diphosphatase